MPFAPGDAAGSDDGGIGSTTSSDQSGLLGRNDSPDTAPKDSAGGSGVFGLTTVHGGAGVFGANNSEAPKGMSLDEADQEHLLPSGVGVQGNGPDAGVSGWSQWGNGVQGLSDKVGVFGQGGELAGHFVGGVSVEGDLNVTGRLLIDGADVAEALRELWDQVNALRD